MRQPPPRPLQGQPVPADYFGQLHDYLLGLRVKGDLRTTRVRYSVDGATISAPFATTDGQSIDNEGGGAILVAEITADNNDGSYDAVAQYCDNLVWADRTASEYDFDSGNEGNLYELNERRGVPIGTRVVVLVVEDADGGTKWYFDSVDQSYSLYGAGAWAEITGGSGSTYSWKLKEQDGSTDETPAVTGTNDATEVDGRQGIPNGSIVWLRWDGATSPEGFVFTYHGADQGTKDAMDDGTSTTANTDTWDRAVQGTDRGVDQQFVARIVADTTSDEVWAFCRDKYHDANGHLTNYTTETKKLIGIISQSANTTPYKNCDTDAVVARFAIADIPTHDYAYVYDGSAFIPCYRDSASAGAATSPVPCVVKETADPGSCANLGFEAFDDDFSDSSLDTCRWTDNSEGSASLTETTSLEMDAPSGDDARIATSCPIGSDDFSFEIDFTNLSMTVSGSDVQFFIYVVIGGTGYQVGYIDSNGGTDGEYVYDGSFNYYGSLPSSGTAKIERVGTSLKCSFDGTVEQTITISGSLTELSVRVAPGAGSSGNVDITDANFTGG